MGALKENAQSKTAEQGFRAMNWWSEADLLQLTKGLDLARLRWRSEWLDGLAPVSADSANPGVSCVLAHQADAAAAAEEPEWQALFPELEAAGTVAAIDSQVWIDTGPVSSAMLQAILLGTEVKQLVSAKNVPGIATEMIHAAWHDCIKELRRSLVQDDLDRIDDSPQLPFGLHRGIDNMLPPHQLLAWSGAVSVTLPWHGLLLKLHIGPGRVAALLQSDERVPAARTRTGNDVPLVPLHKAIEKKTTSLRLELAAVELDLGSLQALVLGDVIPLPHRLDQPLQVLAEDGRPLCTAYLGQQQGMRAIELFRSATEDFSGKTPAL